MKGWLLTTCLLRRGLLGRRLLGRCLLLQLLLSLLAGATRAEAAVTATVTASQLVVTGDAGANQITVRSIPFNASRLEVLDGSVSLGSFARSTFTSIAISGLDGNDVITLSGPFPIIEPAAISGGAGNDTIKGGAGPDTLFGGSGSDVIIWNPTDGNDVIGGGDDIDRLEFNATAADDHITVARNPAAPRFSVTLGSTAIIDVGTIEGVVVTAGEGNDLVEATGELASLIDLVLDGGPGDDTLRGGNGPDVLRGGPGRDDLSGRQNDDVVFGGPGDDVIRWRLDEGNDQILSLIHI